MCAHGFKDSFGGSKVTIAPICETNCPALTSRSHVWTSRPWSVDALSAVNV